MQILYTGATKQGVIQLEPGKSLGGLVSGSLVPNDTLSNIFSSVSELAIQNKRREVKMVALKNNNGDVVTDVSFKFSIELDTICKYKIAFVNPNIASDHVCFEEIENSNALPYYATFQDIFNESEIDVPELANGAYLGVWLMREFDYTSDDLKKKTCDDWFDKSENPTEVNQKETFGFTLDFTIGEPSVSSSSSSSTSVSL